MSSDPTSRLLDRLEQAGCSPRAAGTGYAARCPAHDDTHPSLSIARGVDGRALIHCHAGCAPEAVVAELGLKLSDLSADPPLTSIASSNGDLGQARTHTAAQHRPPTTYPTAEAALGELTRRQRGAPSAVWQYLDAAGRPVGLVPRWDARDDRKTYRPVSLTGDGWILGGMREPRPLYRLPQLLDADRAAPVIVVEGEKAADAAASCGLLATTSPHGANSAAKADWSPLAGRDVVVVPDRDKAGESYAAQVVELARHSGAARVRMVRLADHWPALPAGGDFADAITLQGGDVAAVAEAFAKLLTQVEVATPRRTRANLVPMSEVQPRDVDWLWPGRVPLGRITLLVGRPGCGKSFLTMDMAARVSTGTPWPDGTPCPQGSVVLISAEDDPHDTLRPRLDAHGADAECIRTLRGIVHADGRSDIFSLTDLDALADAIARTPDLRLVVIDPIGSYLGGRTNANADNQVRAILTPLAALAERHGFACLIVAHTRKAIADFADDTALGSRAFVGLARSVLHLTAHPDDNELRCLLPGKINIAAPAAGLAFRIEGDPASVHWEPGSIDLTADEAIHRVRDGGSQSKIEDAEDFLLAELADGPRLVKDLKAAAQRQNVAWRTIEEAKRRHGVHAQKSPGKNAGWLWELPVARKAASPPCVSDLCGLPPDEGVPTRPGDHESSHRNLDSNLPDGAAEEFPPKAAKTASSLDTDTGCGLPAHPSQASTPPAAAFYRLAVADLLRRLGRADIALMLSPTGHGLLHSNLPTGSEALAGDIAHLHDPLVRLLAGEGVPNPHNADDPAGHLFGERLAIAEDLGLDATPGSAAWCTALAEAVLHAHERTESQPIPPLDLTY